MKDYIRKVIYSDVLKQGDVMRGKTGFHYWDNLSQEERNEARRKYMAEWKSMSPQERGKFIDEFQASIRAKQRADGGRLINASSYDVVREMMNVDEPKSREEAAVEAERYGYLELAQHLRRQKIGVENIKINIIDDNGNIVDEMIL
ncbi:MAG: hypothetical protein ACREAS_07060 [Nitrososphaera sp.]